MNGQRGGYTVVFSSTDVSLLAELVVDSLAQQRSTDTLMQEDSEGDGVKAPPYDLSDQMITASRRSRQYPSIQFNVGRSLAKGAISSDPVEGTENRRRLTL